MNDKMGDIFMFIIFKTKGNGYQCCCRAETYECYLTKNEKIAIEILAEVVAAQKYPLHLDEDDVNLTVYKLITLDSIDILDLDDIKEIEGVIELYTPSDTSSIIYFDEMRYAKCSARIKQLYEDKISKLTTNFNLEYDKPYSDEKKKEILEKYERDKMDCSKLLTTRLSGL